MLTNLLLAAVPITLAALNGWERSAEPKTIGQTAESIVNPMTSPTRVAVTRAGRLVVTDYRGRSVHIIDRRKLLPVLAFPIDGRPTGVAVLGRVIYVGNETARRVEAYTRRGVLLGAVGGGIEVGDPTDMAIDPERGLLFVVDGAADHIKVFDLNAPGTALVGTIGAPGDAEGNLQKPTGIAIDTDNQQVFVSDYGDPFIGTGPRVLSFDYDGVLLGVLRGKAGMLGYNFSKPQGLALNDAGQLFIVDAWLGRVVVYDRASGTKLGEIGTYGTGPMELRLPLDVVLVGPAQDLFVTNNGSGRIEVFPGGGQP